jgi:hypothetical protein
VYHLRVQVLPLVPGEVCQVHQQERLHHVRHEGAFLLTLLLPVSLSISVMRYHYEFFYADINRIQIKNADLLDQKAEVTHKKGFSWRVEVFGKIFFYLGKICRILFQL